jgi:GNAT superfamily N-acetyltransferase
LGEDRALGDVDLGSRPLANDGLKLSSELMMQTVDYRIDPPLDDAALNDLFERAWPDHSPRQFDAVLARSLGVVAAFIADRLVGFVNVATDGGEHAFLLDPTVDRAYQRQGIGSQLVLRATALSRTRGCTWLHVDYEAALAPFYQALGFRDSLAGVMRLDHTT